MGSSLVVQPDHPAQVTVDLDAIANNAATLVALGQRSGAETMAVVKANAYGHGLVPCARAALAGGASWLGVAQASEALRLRESGVAAPLLTWLYSPHADLSGLLEADVDVSVSSEHALKQVAAAARHTGRRARVHLKVDTGLGRNGVPAQDLPELARRLHDAESDGLLQVVGLWSHFAWADAPDHPTVRGQQGVFEEALEVVRREGLRPTLRHLANSAATLTNPTSHYDLVRPGLALYGLSPVPDISGPADFGLRPAMTVSSELAMVKHVGRGQGVSYAHAYTTPADTSLALVPLGYADGVPRAASDRGPVSIAGQRFRVAGRVCMDQFVVDVGVDGVAADATAILFGDGATGAPTAQEWAEAAGTISYEIVTRFAPLLPRCYVGSQAREWTAELDSISAAEVAAPAASPAP